MVFFLAAAPALLLERWNSGLFWEGGLLAAIMFERAACSLSIRGGPWAVVSVLPLGYCSGWNYVRFFFSFVLTLLALPRV